MASRIEVKGLTQAKDNFQKLSGLVQKEIGRETLREAGWMLARPMRAATYTTFVRRTGAIRSGLGVAIQRDAKSDKLTGYVDEFPQSIAGKATPFAKLVRHRLSLKRRRSVPTTYIAFWWRYLEFGTGPRRAGRTPAFLRSGKVGTTAKGKLRQIKAVGGWLKSPNRGGIKPRPWLRPIFGSNAPNAIESFRATILKLIDAAVSAMPK
jgi:HK97 gp10 family phage protein